MFYINKLIQTIKLTPAIIGISSLFLLTGCAEDSTSVNEATFEIAEVKGISFDAPLPGPSGSTTENPAIDQPAQPTTSPIETSAQPTPALKTATANLETPIKHATAADVPDNIAMIPSATPVPTQTPDATPTEPSPTPRPEIATATTPGDFKPISFKILSGYEYIEPIPNEGDRPEEVEARRQSDQIPADVQALDGAKAIVEGWMVPMEINEDNSVKSFVLVKTQPQCCFGDMQAMNEWIDVMMQPGQNAEFNVDSPIKVYGQLEVGEKTEDGFVLSIYRMKATRAELM